METIRIGVIGIGNMGKSHVQNLVNASVPGGQLTAVCDIDPEKLKWTRSMLGDEIRLFDRADALYASGSTDAVIISVPHYDHPALACAAFEKGLHVLVEKPAGVYAKQVRAMNEAALKSRKVFGIMYNQRTNPLYQKFRDLVKSGELGELKRTNWIITNWYRPQSYYNSGDWRATWAGEGGGVLLNQCPHNLDLWQWICGMPVRVKAFMYFGKYHDIEVEDDVTAFVEYANGATGVFVASTADAPGTNRLEVTGDRGKIIAENGKLTFWRLRTPEREFNRNFSGPHGSPECWKCEIPITGIETAHAGIMTDWVRAIQKGTALLAPGSEGIRGLQISNAMHLSAWINDYVKIPADEDLFFEQLQGKITNSKK